MKILQLYVSPGCPDCAALKGWLADHAIAWEEHDLSKSGVAEDAKRRLGVRVAPISVIHDQVLYGTFAEQLPRLKVLLGITD